MTNNNIYEIALKMQNKNVLQNDLNEAFSLITNMFRDKYVSKLQKAIHSQQLETKNNPSKEIQLLHSLKPFFKESSQEPIDKTINTLYMLQTLENLKRDSYSTLSTSTTDTSIHEDGVYDIDHNCVFSKTAFNSSFLNTLMVLALTMPRAN